jgi:ACR3 family arsenite efflux pump ArsB
MLALLIEYGPVIASLLVAVLLPLLATAAQRAITRKLSSARHLRRQRRRAASETRYGPGVPITRRQLAPH